MSYERCDLELSMIRMGCGVNVLMALENTGGEEV